MLERIQQGRPGREGATLDRIQNKTGARRRAELTRLALEWQPPKPGHSPDV